VLVVGGGVNGAVSTAALASRGARVALIDRGDFAGFTSQQSSNLAWGGIKYMETFEFPLVRGLCRSRNELMRSYPSTVKEIRFLATVPRGFRHHPLKLWAGAWAYWLIGDCFTRAPRYLSRRGVEHEVPVVRAGAFAGFFEYSDAYLFDNDARFVFNFVRTALDRGGVAANYVESVGAERRDGKWQVRARDRIDGRELRIVARVLINAAGAFVDDHNALSGQSTEHHHVFSKGVHLIVNRVTPERRVLAFFADDGRLFFAIPMGSKTCLGTTDTRVTDPDTRVTDDDRRYVLDNINRCLDLPRPFDVGDIIAERCGVRPLAVRAGEAETTDFLQLSRRHAIDVDPAAAHLSIFGGKLTDCINVGDEVCAHVTGMGVTLPYADLHWYGEPRGPVRKEYFHRARLMDLDARTAPHCTEPLSERLWRRYGLEALGLLERIVQDPEQATILIRGTEYIRAEIDLAAQREMIVTLDDFLRRRSKIALMMRRDEIRAADGLMEACRILFGEDAEARYREYFEENDLHRVSGRGASVNREPAAT
jgi:glycerol-3-phosphate dehydrogenase